MLGGARPDGVSRLPLSAQSTNTTTNNNINTNNIHVSGTTPTTTTIAPFLAKEYTQAAAPSERVTLAIPVITTALGVRGGAGGGGGVGVGSSDCRTRPSGDEAKPGIYLRSSDQPTYLPTHVINKLCQHSLSTHPIFTIYLHILSTHSINTSY